MSEQKVNVKLEHQELFEIITRLDDFICNKNNDMHRRYDSMVYLYEEVLGLTHWSNGNVRAILNNYAAINSSKLCVIH